jgi:hypothetical protein
MNFEQRAVDNLHRYLRPYLKKHAPVASGIRFGPNTAEGALLALQAEVAREVLGAHVAGYSTTAHDFFHDLIP